MQYYDVCQENSVFCKVCHWSLIVTAMALLIYGEFWYYPQTHT